MEVSNCIFLGIKVKPGPIERFKLDNFALDNTVDCLKNEAEKKANIPSASLELIHHGKILKDNITLQECGIKNGEMVHVVKKKQQSAPPPPPTYTDSELQLLNSSLRTLGCTPNAPGWTSAMQLLNDESAMAEIMEVAPTLSEDCVALSILHEVELLAALGANIQTMRRGADAHPYLPNALRRLTRLVRLSTITRNVSDAPTSGFAYSLEALSEDEDADDDDNEEGERTPITQEQLAAALQAVSETVSSTSGGSSVPTPPRTTGVRPVRPTSLLRLLNAPLTETTPYPNMDVTQSTNTAGRSLITPEMFSEAISEAIHRAPVRSTVPEPMEQSTTASSSHSPVSRDEDYRTQLNHMHEMGLLDDALNVRALLICSGDVNAAINLVFSGAIADE